MLESAARLKEAIERFLACPRCYAALTVESSQIRCLGTACDFRGAVADDVVLIRTPDGASYFDGRYQVMQHGNANEGVRCLCYEQQARFVEPYLRPGSVVLDVGCGPALPYSKDPDCFLIGLDPSLESLRANKTVDLRVYGTAAALPVPDHSIDTVLCFYSIHHMVGETVKENQAMVARVLREFARVVKPGGQVFIFEVSPWLPFWLAQRAVWDVARHLLGSKLDMYFWSPRRLFDVGRAAFPEATPQRIRFGASPLKTFPPVFSMPWLKVPRLLYPFHVMLYHWHF